MVFRKLTLDPFFTVRSLLQLPQNFKKRHTHTWLLSAEKGMGTFSPFSLPRYTRPNEARPNEIHVARAGGPHDDNPSVYHAWLPDGRTWARAREGALHEPHGVHPRGPDGARAVCHHEGNRNGPHDGVEHDHSPRCAHADASLALGRVLQPDLPRHSDGAGTRADNQYGPDAT